jgi:hypothetical protein
MNKLVFILLSIFVLFAITNATSCDCNAEAIRICGTHGTFAATACRNNARNACARRCAAPPAPRAAPPQPQPAANPCDCNAEAIRKCGTHGTFVATACRNNAKNACNQRCAAPPPPPVQPAPVTNPCDCYQDSINKCGPHSVENIPCRQQSAEECNRRCPSNSCDCSGLAVQRCGTVVTFIGTTCRTVIQNDCTKRCTAPPKPVGRVPQPKPVVNQ